MDNLITNPYLNVAIRSLAVYLFMLVAIRLSGKKELSQLNTSDVVLILLISNAVQNAMVGQNTSLSGGIVAAAMLFLANYTIKKLMARSKPLHDLIASKPEVLIRHGVLFPEQLKHLDITQDELEEAMREHGVDQITDVRLAMLEMDGNISIITGNDTEHLQSRQIPFRHRRPRKAPTGGHA